MSVASIAREKARRLANMEKVYGPFPGPGEVPPPIEQQDPELVRLLVWWYEKHREVADTLGFEKLWMSDSEGVRGIRKPPKLDKKMVELAGILTMFGGNLP